MTGLTHRQQREVDFHAEYAKSKLALRHQPTETDVVYSNTRRWWNGYWHLYTVLRELNLSGKRVLVPGCGFGDDVIRLAMLGAEVHGSDISPEIVSIATDRAKLVGVAVQIQVMPAEALNYPDNHFDAVLFVDILHHVDISATVPEVIRVLKPGAMVIGSDLYTHSALQRIRESWLVRQVLYPRMVKSIYGTATPYITADEHKIDEAELELLTRHLTLQRTDWFMFLAGRVVSHHRKWASMIDRALLMMLGSLGRYLANRIVFVGLVHKN